MVAMDHIDQCTIDLVQLLGEDLSSELRAQFVEQFLAEVREA